MSTGKQCRKQARGLYILVAYICWYIYIYIYIYIYTHTYIYIIDILMLIIYIIYIWYIYHIYMICINSRSNLVLRCQAYLPCKHINIHICNPLKKTRTRIKDPNHTIKHLNNYIVSNFMVSLIYLRYLETIQFMTQFQSTKWLSLWCSQKNKQIDLSMINLLYRKSKWGKRET